MVRAFPVSVRVSENIFVLLLQKECRVGQLYKAAVGNNPRLSSSCGSGSKTAVVSVIIEVVG